MRGSHQGGRTIPDYLEGSGSSVGLLGGFSEISVKAFSVLDLFMKGWNVTDDQRLWCRGCHI